MRLARLFTVVATFGVVAAGDVVPAMAQSGDPATQVRRPRAATRIEVTPNRQLVRVCEDWLALEHRPSGDVITPQMRCRWAHR